RDSPNLERLGFNDKAESVIVEGGTWRLCSDSRGEGACREFRPGQYPVLTGELRNRVSSAFKR
ncbi:MAG TPA: beta/gamma crystallin-related protein, partial [Usitatibacteraceae bacterium]|nr:beta/gamma crystallin-related protein [Usitatibacteraceae bacterium]